MLDQKKQSCSSFRPASKLDTKRKSLEGKPLSISKTFIKQSPLSQLQQLIKDFDFAIF